MYCVLNVELKKQSCTLVTEFHKKRKLWRIKARTKHLKKTKFCWHKDFGNKWVRLYIKTQIVNQEHFIDKTVKVVLGFL